MATDAKYSKYNADTEFKRSVTRTRLMLGELVGSGVAAALNGVVYAIETLLAEHGKSLKGSAFAIQGFGIVRSVVAMLVWKRGGKIVGVTDYTRGVKISIRWY